MEYVTLSNGVKMPQLGYGVYQVSKDECERCVLDALSVGYRHIDTAQSYFNEEEVGEAIAKSGVPRSEIFLTTKVWVEHYGYDETRARIKPMVNQVETHPHNQQIEAHEWMVKYGVQHEAWAPFGEGRGGMFEEPVLVEIGKQYGKTSAQVILRWELQRGIVVIPKSVHKERMEQNFDVFDFTLSDEDMKAIAALDKKQSSFFSHTDPKMVEWFAQMVEERKHNNDHRKEKKNW